MPSYWVTVGIDAPTIQEAVDAATAHGGIAIDSCLEPPQGSTIVGRFFEDEDGPLDA